MMFFEKLDLSHARKVFVVGDIHGMFTLLDETLATLGFDRDQDHLLSVGDLVDRGPENHRAIEYTEYPWFHFVRGNHEQLLAEAANGRAKENHERNGGQWFTLLDQTEKDLFSFVLNDAPVVMEVTVPSGRHIGIIHGGFPTNDWKDVYDLEVAYHRSWTEYCMWDRDRIKNPPKKGIRNIDHVYFGHTPLKEPITVGNCSWIDTGACRTGVLTVWEID